MIKAYSCRVCESAWPYGGAYCRRCGVLGPPLGRTQPWRVALLSVLALGLIVAAAIGVWRWWPKSAPGGVALETMSFVVTPQGKVHRFNCWLVRRTAAEKLSNFPTIHSVRAAGHQNDCGFCRPGTPLPTALEGFTFGAVPSTGNVHTVLCYWIYRSSEAPKGYTSLDAAVRDGFRPCTLCMPGGVAPTAPGDGADDSQKLAEIIGPTWDSDLWYSYVLKEVEFPNTPVDEFFKSLGVEGWNPRWTPILRDKDGRPRALILSLPRTKIDRAIQSRFYAGVIKKKYTDENLRPGMWVYLIEIKRDVPGKPDVTDPRVRVKGKLLRVAEFDAGRISASRAPTPPPPPPP